jgi:hypothetical protein
MRVPDRDNYCDDLDGYERAWDAYECYAESERERKREDEIESAMVKLANERSDEMSAKYGVELCEDREAQRQRNAERNERI